MYEANIYITEPDAIDLNLVRAAFGKVPYTLVLGNPEFTKNDCSVCDIAIIRSATYIDSSLKDKMPLLKSIVRIGTGLDAIDLEFCHQAGIAVYNAAGANANAAADYAVAVIMMAIRKLHLLDQDKVMVWDRFKFMGRDIGSCTIGIVGFGNIGRLVYEKFRGLGCANFMLHDPFVEAAPKYAHMVSLEDLMRASDVISLNLPLLPQTKYYIGKQNLELLKGNAILLNASRGGIVDEVAILEALKTKHFMYIADAVEGEPYVNKALLKQPNIIITPHIASLTQNAEKAMVTVAINNLLSDRRVLFESALKT